METPTRARLCEECGKKLVGKDQKRYCGQSCFHVARSRNSQVDLTCQQCGKRYQRLRCVIRDRVNVRFCSRACQADAQTKISGARHPCWKDGKWQYRNTRKYKAWRLAVLARDQRTCQACGCNGSSRLLIAHHLKCFHRYPRLRFAVDNGQTLCLNCHTKIHVTSGHFRDAEKHRESVRKYQQQKAREYAEAKGFKEGRKCEQCGKVFGRSRSSSGRLEPWVTYNNRRFCSHSCHLTADNPKLQAGRLAARSHSS